MKRRGMTQVTIGDKIYEFKFTYHPGYPATRLDPPDPEDYEIDSLVEIVDDGEEMISPEDWWTVVEENREKVLEAIHEALSGGG